MGTLVRFEALSAFVDNFAQFATGATATPIVLRRRLRPAPHSAQTGIVTSSFIIISLFTLTRMDRIFPIRTLTRVWVVSEREIFRAIDAFVRFFRFTR